MKSGLYACAGASATASAAAWAKRFDEPITKRSNVYFGLRPLRSRRRGSCPSPAQVVARLLGLPALRGKRGRRPGALAGTVSTVSSTRRSEPRVSRTPASTSPRKWFSIHSRVNSFGTARTNVSSSSAVPCAPSNQVEYVWSLSAPRRRSATSVHRVSALSSRGRSTASPCSFPTLGSGDSSSGPNPRKTRDLGIIAGRKSAGFAGPFGVIHSHLHSVDRWAEVAWPARFGLWTAWG